MHISIDAELGLAHNLSTTSANVHDITEADKLLHGDETDCWGDAGYQVVEKRKKHKGKDTEWHVAMRPAKRWGLDPESTDAKKEEAKASTRAKVEHPFRYVKRVRH